MAARQQVTTAFAFDATGIAPATIFEKIPNGMYPCQINSGEVRATTGKGAGTRITFEFEVIDGEYKGRKFWSGINVKHSDAQTQEIGAKEMSALCHATGRIRFADAMEFKGDRLMVSVGCGKGDYAEKNEAKGFKALEGAVATGAPAFIPGAPQIPGAPAAFTPPPVPGQMPPPVPQAAPAAPAPPAPVAAFPPAPWVDHPQSPGFVWNQQTNEVIPTEQLRAMLTPAAPVAPVAAPMPAPIPQAAPAPVAMPAPVPMPAPVAEAFPPAGWAAHPQSAGWFYNLANPADMKDEAALRASLGAPGAPAVPGLPAAGGTPPWTRPA